MIHPITIVGGGLTGLSLAIALRKNDIPVILHEAGTYPRHRVCGEFISGVTQFTLDTLGISYALADALRHRTLSWFSGNRLLRHTTLPEPALGISRHTLDLRLRDLALSLGANIRTTSRIRPVPSRPGIVWAAGRRPAPGKWLGLKAHVRDLPLTAHLEMHNGPIGYLGITPVEDGWNNICGLFHVRPDLPERHSQLLPAYLHLNGNHHLADHLASATWRPGSFTAIAGFSLGLQENLPGLLTLGDSHAIIPPFTGNGMSMAFQSAESALPHLIAFARNEISWQATSKAISRSLRKRFQTRLKTAAFIHPLLFQPAAIPILKHTPITPLLHLIR